MSEHATAKVKKLNELLDGIAVLTTEMEAEDGKGNTPENREKLAAQLKDGEELRKSIEQDNIILGLQNFAKAPVGDSKAYPRGGDGLSAQPYKGILSPGEAFVESEAYKSMVGKSRGRGTSIAVESPITPAQLKATFDSTSTGLQTYIGYQAGPILVEQQRLTVRDLLSVGRTNLSSVPYIQETSFTNAATTVAEEGEKPEATFALQDEFAPVKKIAVIAKVTDEMWNDFPTLRDYINSRLRFMVEAKEEQQLLAGAGTGSEITGILTASIQSQATASDTVPDAIHKAITKVRTVGFFEPDGIVMHPNDWQDVRLLKDDDLQYYGGGPFTGAYGNGGIAGNSLWGLRVVVTTAITENTALVGAFKLGAQIWDREGITVDATNSDEDDFRFNRMAIRVEERLALAIYRLNAFCKVTSV
jgi:HK97 family phage major capsid protein